MIRHNLKLGILLVAIVLFSACSSKAQSTSKKEKTHNQPPSIEELFKTMDKDEDGKLSKDEVKGPLKKDFSKVDTDDDGFLTKKELKKAPKPERRGAPKNRKH